MEIFQQLLPVRLEELPPGSRIAILPVLQEFLRGLIGAAGIEAGHPDLRRGSGQDLISDAPFNVFVFIIEKRFIFYKYLYICANYA